MMMRKKEGLPLSVEYEVEVRDKSGKLISRQHGKSHSWLKQFIQMLMAEWQFAFGGSNPTGVSILDETGAARSMPPPAGTYFQNCAWGISAPAGSSEYGVKVGGGDTPNSLLTYALASPISHGTGSGQLVYGAHTIESVINPSGNDLTFRVTRVFTNNSGATVTVKEIGITTKRYDQGASARTFLFIRDVLPSPTSVPDGASLTIRYTVKITVS
jgi:hypothetical protein